MSELSISNVIRVTVQGVQRSRTPKNVNDVALFTPEQSNNVSEYMYVIDPSDVAEAYGSDSLKAISKEMEARFAEIDRIAKNAELCYTKQVIG